MVLNNKEFTFLKTKFSLVFFSLFLFCSCEKTTQKINVTPNIKNNKIESISIYGNVTEDYKIVLKDSKNPILGNYTLTNDTLLFKPIIPLTANTYYQILNENLVVDEFIVEQTIALEKPKVLEIYPKTDSVPENLLKMYVKFSKPMQEVKKALDFITIIENDTKKEVAIFLDLETELWNENHTELTLWLNPGRIKKDLIPNKTLGKPIVQGKNYTITINKSWFDAQGLFLEKEYTKQITVTASDTEKPSIQDFVVQKPTYNTLQSLHIQSTEILDVMLVGPNIEILLDHQIIEGTFTYSNNAKHIYFTPKQEWEKGKYLVRIKSQLEDLAGNNFNRLFDRDITKDKLESKTMHELTFVIP